MRPRLDLRLVPAAVVAAGAAALVVVLPAVGGLGIGALALVLAVACALPVTRGQARVRGQVVISLLVGAAVMLAGAAQVAARETGGLPRLAAERAVVRLEGTVRGDPVAVTGDRGGEGGRYRVLVGATAMRARGAEVRVAAPVVVLGGSDWADVAYGSTVVVTGRLASAPPGRREVAVLAAADGPREAAAPPEALVVVARLRAGLLDLADDLPGDAGALLPGVAVGDTSRVPDDLDAAMRTSGLTHLTAVSGAHFAMVGATVLVAASAIRLRRPVRVAVVTAALVGFVALVRPGPSVLRAAAMGALGVGGLMLGRPSRALSALATGVVVLLVADPWLVREMGFLLSVVATVGLVLLAGPLATRWSGTVGAPAAYALAVPVAAQCACAPLLILLEPSLSTYAVPANVLADPAVAPATVLGLLAALTEPWWPAAATVLSQLAGAACWWIGWVARTAAGLPGARLTWPAGAGGALLLATGTLAGLGLALSWRRPVQDEGVGTRRQEGPL